MRAVCGGQDRIPRALPGAVRPCSAEAGLLGQRAPWARHCRMESKTAKEILAEVLRIRISDVEEMIQNRFEVHYEEARHEEDGLWPQEFWLEG